MNIKDFRYVYNLYQAQYYINNDIELVEVNKTNKGYVYYKFKDSVKLQQVFKNWCARNKN